MPVRNYVLTKQEITRMKEQIAAARSASRSSVTVHAHYRRKHYDLTSQVRMDQSFLACVPLLNRADKQHITERDRTHARILIALLQEKFDV